MMLTVLLVVGFLYIANLHIIISHADGVGEFTVNDLIHVVLGPITLTTVILIKFVSHFVELETPLWKRSN
jgi:hypothetical protein